MTGGRWRGFRACRIAALAAAGLAGLLGAAQAGAQQGHPADGGRAGVVPGRYVIKVDLPNARRVCRLELSGETLRERAGRTWYVARMGEGDRNTRDCEGLGFWEIEGWHPVDAGRQVWIMPGTAVSGEWRIIFIRDPDDETGADAADRIVYRAPGGFNREGREPHDLLLQRERVENEGEDAGE